LKFYDIIQQAGGFKQYLGEKLLLKMMLKKYMRKW